MFMTNAQKEFLSFILNNKDTLNECMTIINKCKNIEDFEIKESIKIAGINWSKFTEDKEGNSYMLADKIIYEMTFGTTNDWRKSDIREKLNEELYKEITNEIGNDILIPIHTDLLSMDGFKDYGSCEDMVSLLTFDLYRDNSSNISLIDTPYWLATPNQTPTRDDSQCVQFVCRGGCLDYKGCGYDGLGVRPFLILKNSYIAYLVD